MNLERFLMGRQIFVVVTVFLAARLTTQDDMDKLFAGRLPEWFQASLMETGLLGVVVVAVFGQLTPQIIASAYPVEFMQIVPGVYFVCYVCLAFETLGLVHFCYRVADLFIWLFGIKGKEESKDVLEDAIANESNTLSESANEAEKLKAKITDKLKALCDVMDKIAESQNTDYESQIFQLAMQRHPNLFMNFPTIVGRRQYASPQQVLEELINKGYSGPTPAFLLPISNPNHIPPHIFACQVMAYNMGLKRAIAEAKGVEIDSDYGGNGHAIERIVKHDLLFSRR